MTDPKQVAKWWGPRGFSTTIETMDVRPGGIWKQVMHGPDGANYPNESVFAEVTPPEKLVFTHAGRREGGPSVECVKVWTFAVVPPDKTKVSIRMLFPNQEERDRVAREFRAIEAGRQTLARLDEQLTVPTAEAVAKL